MNGALGFGSGVNKIGLDALIGGDFHLGYAALGVVLVGLLVVGVHLWLGIALVVLGVGIFVDLWAHGNFH